MTINITFIFIVKSGRRILWRVSLRVTIHIYMRAQLTLQAKSTSSWDTELMGKERLDYEMSSESKSNIWDKNSWEAHSISEKIYIEISWNNQCFLSLTIVAGFLAMSTLGRSAVCFNHPAITERTSEISKSWKTARSDIPVKGSHHLIKIKAFCHCHNYHWNWHSFI